MSVSLDPEYIMPCGVPAYGVDLGIAVEHMALTAVEEGLGTCWIGAFSQKEIKQVLKIPQNYQVVALMPLGFPADKADSKTRKNLEEIVSYEDFH